MTTAELTAAYEKAKALRIAASDLFSHHWREEQRIEADLAEAQGDTDRAAFLRLMNDPSASDEAKHAAYIRSQARTVADHPHVIEVLPARERDEVRAEVERILAERDAATEFTDSSAPGTSPGPTNAEAQQ